MPSAGDLIMRAKLDVKTPSCGGCHRFMDGCGSPPEGAVPGLKIGRIGRAAPVFPGPVFSIGAIVGGTKPPDAGGWIGLFLLPGMFSGPVFLGPGIGGGKGVEPWGGLMSPRSTASW